MEPIVTWLDLTAGDRDKMQRVLNLFGQSGTVDEMGLGTLRDAISGILFPGVTSIQTRLRYVLFVPWIYRSLERRRITADKVEEDARRAEIQLIGPLEETREWGVIGVSARQRLQRLPSSVYWSCIRRWGIFQHGGSQSWYHSEFARLRDASRQVGRADDPGVDWQGKPNWHPRLPEPPDGFPAGATFRLSEAEAVFVQGLIEDRCSGSLLALLARQPSDQLAEHFWEEPDALGAGGAIGLTVELARRFSLHVEGIPLLYNLMLAERHGDVCGDPEDWVGGYMESCAAWADREAGEEDHFDLDALCALVERSGTRVKGAQRAFLQAWTNRLAEIGPESVAADDFLRTLVADRERVLKGRDRARLLNTERLVDWGGSSGVGRMDFKLVQGARNAGGTPRGVELMLSPDVRTVAVDLLRPAAGYELDLAIPDHLHAGSRGPCLRCLSRWWRIARWRRGCTPRRSVVVAPGASRGRRSDPCIRRRDWDCRSTTSTRTLRHARAICTSGSGRRRPASSTPKSGLYGSFRKRTKQTLYCALRSSRET